MVEYRAGIVHAFATRVTTGSKTFDKGAYSQIVLTFFGVKTVENSKGVHLIRAFVSNLVCKRTTYFTTIIADIQCIFCLDQLFEKEEISKQIGIE